ncbi:MAG: hypothetical protein PSV46_11935 [Reyranella sp.]|nr:hypothetical protein [Reyranella sp.]
MGTFWAVWKPIALPVLKELLIPLAGGAVYGSIVGHTERSSLDGLTAGGVAFFCLLAVQSLVLRAAANARDHQPALKIARDPAPETATETATEAAKDPAPEAVDDFVSIRRGIDDLKQQGAWPEVGPENREDGQKPLFRDLAHSVAKKTPVEALTPGQLLTLKMPYQAVLNAAVNFEREIRRRAEIPDERTIPLAQLFRQPQLNLSKEKIQQLDTLRRMRNSILHGFETIVYPLEAAELVAAFDRAASWFEPPKEAT